MSRRDPLVNGFAAAAAAILWLAACDHSPASGSVDASTPDASGSGADAAGANDANSLTDGAVVGADAMPHVTPDAGMGVVDAGPPLVPDARVVVLPPDAAPLPADAAPPAPDAAPANVITGGPCISGTPGRTAYRIAWAGNGSGSTAYPVYEVNGLPDHSRDHAGAYGYQIGFTPVWDDPFLGDGGLVLNGSDFVDLEISTAGITQLEHATLSIYGRSFNVTTPGSFNWQTFDGTGGAPDNLVSNSVPYEWYSADMTTEIHAGDNGVLLRIYAGPSSDSLIVNRIEICMRAS